MKGGGVDITLKNKQGKSDLELQGLAQARLRSVVPLRTACRPVRAVKQRYLEWMPTIPGRSGTSNLPSAEILQQYRLVVMRITVSPPKASR